MAKDTNFLKDKLERTDMRMIKLMCRVSLRDNETKVALLKRIRVEAIYDVMRRNRLKWLGHVEWKSEDDWVRGCMHMEVPGV